MQMKASHPCLFQAQWWLPSRGSTWADFYWQAGLRSNEPGLESQLDTQPLAI